MKFSTSTWALFIVSAAAAPSQPQHPNYPTVNKATLTLIQNLEGFQGNLHEVNGQKLIG
jgi:hypothetical protein